MLPKQTMIKPNIYNAVCILITLILPSWFAYAAEPDDVDNQFLEEQH